MTGDDGPLESMRILLTAFGPFGEHAANASLEAARRVASEGLPGAEIEVLELPVAAGAADEAVLEALARFRPDAVVMTGLNEHAETVRPERVAINVDDFRIPDSAGGQPCDRPVVEGGPAAYFSTLPLRRMLAALEAAGVPAELSNSAGTYVCNHVFYAVRHHIESAGVGCSAGFVHVPQMREAAPADKPSMPLDDIVRGLRAVITAVMDPGSPGGRAPSPKRSSRRQPGR